MLASKAYKVDHKVSSSLLVAIYLLLNKKIFRRKIYLLLNKKGNITVDVTVRQFGEWVECVRT